MEYWKVCIEEALSEIGIDATDEQQKELIEWVEGAYENMGTATGSEHIPNPMLAEIEEAKQALENAKRAHERQLLGIAKGVAQRRNVGVNDVSIDSDGLVYYR